MGLFGQPKSRPPKELVREWTSNMRKEDRKLARQIQSIQREEDKIKKSLKDAAKKGQKDVCQIYAKEIVRSKKAINRIYTTKANINSVIYQMKNQESVIRISGAMEQSAVVMKAMGDLVKVADVNKTMMEMSKEMMKAGLIEEMLEDTMEGFEDQDELEDEAQEEVDKVLWELTAGALGDAPAAVKDSLPAQEQEEAPAEASALVDEDISDMQDRLQALRS